MSPFTHHAEAILLHATNRRISETIIEKAKELAACRTTAVQMG